MSQLSLQDLAILLVEPSPAQSRIIVERLQRVGLDKIEVASDGAEALASLRARRPDLVLSAMYFEDMTGAELIQRIRADETLADLAFMLVSSERDPRNLEPIRQSGVTAILPKPFEVEDLRRALLASLEHLDGVRLSLGDIDPEDLRVLVVDDSRFSLRHIESALRRMGVERIALASNGREAAERIRDEIFDLIVTDYNMPEMDGEQLVNYIRQVSDQPEVPVLMVTSEQDQSRLAAVEQAGVSALLDKPFEVETVRELCRRLLTVD